ncbi:choice-of-anchor I family protein [Yoonia sp. SS1-5]|uniref:Choice-of-anchor I family protein n=1 Tax=Yoonia rhodophyticola TaxID=3137370 RepID=A0AAN0MB94_9RHOB
MTNEQQTMQTSDLAGQDDPRVRNLALPENDAGAPVATESLGFAIAAEFQGEGEAPDDAEGASEVVVHEDGKLYVTNGARDRIDIFDIAANAQAGSIDLSALDGFDSVQSVAVSNGVVAVAISRPNITRDLFGETVELSQPGFVALFDAATGALLSTVDVGNLPDQLTFNADGSQLLVAGEGEKNADTESDDNPLGTVAIIDTTNPAAPAATILDFTQFNGLEDRARDAGIRIQQGVSLAEDVEPEYIAISPDGTQAFVSLQESNAIATIDLTSGAIVDIFSLGTVDFSSESKIDADDNGVVNITNFDNLVGFRMADAIAAFELNGQTYIATANEGDSRDFDEDRVADLAADGLLDPAVDITGLERLEVSTVDGDTDGDGDIDVLHTFSSRSFSIFDAAGNLVFDSGPQFEQIIASRAPERFNDDDGDDGEDRSDAKGPEPEAIIIGEVGDATYAFIGLERDSGIMIYDISDPANSTFVNYIPPAFVDTTAAGDVARHGPETIAFIPAEDSTSGNAQIAVAYEISGSTIVYDIIPATPTLTIPEIQGAGHISAFVGDDVITSGIVTAIDGAGFYVQDPEGDGDTATSDAIFVFTGFGNTDGVAIGDAVRLQGTVGEFIPGGAASGNLSTTQLSNVEIDVLSSGNALPDAVLIGAAGRNPPSEIVISDGELPVNLQDDPGVFNPETDAIDFYESLEGMLATVYNPVAISATNRFGETWVVADDGANVTSPNGGLNDRGGLNLNADADGLGDLNPERIQIQFDADLLPDGFDPADINLGDDLSNITGVIDYGFGNYEVRVTELFAVETPSANVAEITEVVGGDDRLSVATYNVLNVTAAEADGDADQIAQLALQIVENLGTPDILALQEIQDDSGVADDGTLGADATLQAIADAIVAAGGPRYEFVSAVVDEDGENGGVPGGNIRNAFLWNADRVALKDVQTLESDILAEYGVSNADAFAGSRDPLLGVFEFNGHDVTLINNHFSSRFGSTPIFGAEQPFLQAGEDAREQQALAINQVVDALLAADPDANVSVLGDLNTFEFTDELAEDLPGTGDEKVLTNLIDALPGDEAYTFVFQGNSQVLDHVFVTDNLLDGAQVDVVHVNNDFADFASDHEPVVATFLLEQADDLFLVGDRRANVLTGEGGDDIILGLRGRDTLSGGNGDDLIFAGRGRDSVDGGDGDDHLFGGRGADALFGGDGDDLIFGGRGRDNVTGGEGDDTLFGGRGADTFIFAGSFGDDVIEDFNARQDTLAFIDLEDSDIAFADTIHGTEITLTGASEGSVTLIGVFGFGDDDLIA